MKQLQDQGFLIHSSRVDPNDLDSPSFSKPLECTDFTVNQGPKWSEEDSPHRFSHQMMAMMMIWTRCWQKLSRIARIARIGGVQCSTFPLAMPSFSCPSTTKEGGSTKLPPLHDRSQESSVPWSRTSAATHISSQAFHALSKLVM